jgi:hypothetical protein
LKKKGHGVVVVVGVGVAVACGSNNTPNPDVPSPPGDDAGANGSGVDSSATIDSEGGNMKDSPSSGADSSSGNGWNGSFPACSVGGSFDIANNSGSCGTARWSVKTGTDADAPSIPLASPTITTVGALAVLPAPSSYPDSRINSAEKTVFAIKDVGIVHASREIDSDYHLVLLDPTTQETMIVEIPFPGTSPDCLKTGNVSSPWRCDISNARAAVDAKFKVSSSTNNPNIQYATVVGVGFFDNEHGQTGVAPNGIELHPVLGICFGQGCTP